MRYTLKTPYRDGTTHVILKPEDFIARLAVVVPKPRTHMTRYHGVFAPAIPYRISYRRSRDDEPSSVTMLNVLPSVETAMPYAFRTRPDLSCLLP